ncbi:hypothetical protein NKR17_09915 [Priestia flexa]|uniref:Uncharacterized protein n=1 Tax=Priestia flexa TaxID=86664 RepID=A0ABU4JC07_9BACI|nr:hypothetical protein [Priestia flexa]MBY6088670.1 hypothetical protein [Priestia flexa]MCP1189385.1 hypothetical protein [Priestia flexa]MDW8518537.1 hypothetical protein [Priestia flexa]QCS53891.1 hypothetical protein FED53_15480 [Priestia flexa]SIR55395.1 hypothetical protein SAMN05880580_1365 [Priestia flexa]
MSMPNIPNINPEIKLKRNEVINLLLSSIALEEISLSHILQEEAEKTRYSLENCASLREILLITDSVEDMIRTILHKELVLLFKLDTVLKIPEHNYDCGCECGCQC